MLVLALWFLHKEMAGISREAVTAQIREIPVLALVASALFTVCSYLALTAYDATGLRYLGHKMPYRRSALTAFMAFAVGQNVGLAALSGGAIRYRMYSLAGLTASEIATLIVFLTVTFALGALALFGIALILMPTAQTAILKLPPLSISLTGIALITVPVIYMAIAISRREPIRIGNWHLAVPGPGIAFTQICISLADLMFASATLYVLLEPILHIGYFPFLGIYLLAMFAGLVSSVPGGIGIFEAVLLAALPQVPTSALLGTIIVYRLIYYVAPLILALGLLTVHEAQQNGELLRRSTATAGGWLSGIAPQVIGVAVFLAGFVLLVSGAMPAVETRLALVSEAIPLPILELSHLLGSVVGTVLLILARGLFRRLHSAYLLAVLTLSAGIIFSLVKGLDYEEALILGTILFVLWLSRDEFYRLGSIGVQPFSAQWLMAIGIVMVLTLWIGLVSFRHVEYSRELWWQFAFNAEAPRMLRASVVVAVTALGFALWTALYGGKSHQAQPDVIEKEVAQLRTALAYARDSSANVALLGDKRFLWSEDKDAFIMYQVSGRSWIALGDPVGPEVRRENLIWAFRELVDRHDGRTVFYEIGEDCLPVYLDLGLTLFKIGEEAQVSLADFTLQGSDRAALRQANNHAKRAGATFEVISRSEVPSIVSDLRRVSDEWLNDKLTAEKGFSLGSFSESYIMNFDCAVVRLEGEIVAFVNLWPAPSVGELSVDLMRFNQRAPKGVMDYLFSELMLWAAAQNYRYFCLGMAPLSGLEQRPLAPLWNKLGHLVFTHGENFYNFEGLRNYKEKFDPVWKPRYLACPGGWFDLPQSLVDASRLIAGGWSELIIRKESSTPSSTNKMP